MLGHVIKPKLLLHSGVRHASLSASSSEVDGQVVSLIDNLGHIFHIVAEALASGAHQVELITWTIWSKISNVVAEALALGRLTLAFQNLKVHIVFEGPRI